MWKHPRRTENRQRNILIASVVILTIALIVLYYNGMFDLRLSPEAAQTATAVALAGLPHKSTPTSTPLPTPTGTLTPSPTPLPPTPDGLTHAILANNALARSGPGPDYPILGTIPAGTLLTILSRSPNGSWLYIMQPDGLQAWVMTSLFAGPIQIADISAVATLPTPRPPVPATATPDLAGGLHANTVGIVAGHRGLNPDLGVAMSGAFCPDGLTEREVNEAAAVQVIRQLQALGYHAELLDEYDSRLSGYRALAVVSIHADVCDASDPTLTGFKVSSFAGSATPDEDARLVQCLIASYAAVTGLSLHNSVTDEMARNHIRSLISPGTPAAIIETGFLYMDRDLLENHPDVVARGIVSGLQCFLP
jgi:N-acetylmuramoyl-L-alanine amidase